MELQTENGFNNFITNNDFQTTSTRVTKWSDLPVNTIYSIEELKEKIIKKMESMSLANIRSFKKSRW